MIKIVFVLSTYIMCRILRYMSCKIPQYYNRNKVNFPYV